MYGTGISREGNILDSGVALILSTNLVLGIAIMNISLVKVGRMPRISLREILMYH